MDTKQTLSDGQTASKYKLLKDECVSMLCQSLLKTFPHIALKEWFDLKMTTISCSEYCFRNNNNFSVKWCPQIEQVDMIANVQILISSSFLIHSCL